MIGSDDFDNGWDSSAKLVDGHLVERAARRPEVESPLRRETVLLPWLARRLPLPVPEPWVAGEHPLRIRHELLVGAPCPGTDEEHGRAMGAFLRELHAVPVADAQRLGVPLWSLSDTWPRFAAEVLPRLPMHSRATGAALLDRCASAPKSALVHADLGPEHIRVAGHQVTGVIDWTDACIGDPAIDLAWLLFGTGRVVSTAVAETYLGGGALRSRACDWHLLGPWHEVLFGLDTGRPDLVESGLSGVLTRLDHA